MSVKANLTIDGNIIDIDWKDITKYFSETHIDIREIRSINLMLNDDGVQIVFKSHNSEIFKWYWFININGISVTNNQELCDALVVIWKAVTNPAP